MRNKFMLGLWGSIVLSPLAIAQVPLADFAHHPQYEQVKISPDGDYLAASAVVRGRTVLALIHLADMKGVNVVPRDDDDLDGFWWVGPHRVMYTVGERTGGLEALVPTGELYAANADGSDANILFGYRAGGDHGSTLIKHATSEQASGRLIASLRDDPKHALIASYPWNGSKIGVFAEAYKIDLAEGTLTRVATAPMRNASFIADNKGGVRIAWGEDVDQKVKVYYRTGEGADWQRVFDEGTDGKRMQPLMFDRAGNGVYFGCPGDKGAGGICRWDAASHQLTTLWSGNGSDPTELMYTIDDLDVFAVRTEPGRPAVTLLDKQAPEAKLLVALMQQFPGEDVQLRSGTSDGRKAIVFVHADTDPGTFYLYDAGTKKLSFLLARRPWIKPEQMASMEPIDVTARDGLLLHGYLTRPTGKPDAKNLPLVVFVHGGPYGERDDWNFDPDVQMLASRGYAVLQINYRGSGGYGYGFKRAGFGEWGGKMQDDVTDATRWAIAQGIADPQRVCIFGGSYGGYAALEGAVKEPDLYKCTIGYAGIYDLRLMYTRGDIPQSIYGENYLKMVLGENQSELYDRSPIAHLDRLKAKVMLIVGGADQRVPPVQGENLHAALLAQKVDHAWLYERTEGHGYYNEAHVLELYTQLTAFLDQQIGATHAAGAGGTR